MAQSPNTFRGVSAAFVDEVAQRVKSLGRLTEQHGIELSPGLVESAEMMKTQVTGRRGYCVSSVSTASEKSMSMRTKHHPSGSDPLFPEPLDPELSFSSSVYSTQSQKETARQLARLRAKELQKIRGESKAVQQSLRTKVKEIRREALGALSPTSDFEQELEFYDGQLEQMKMVVSGYVTDTHSSDLSPVSYPPPRFPSPPADPLLAELLSLRSDIDALRSRVLAQEELRQKTEGTNKDLEEQISTLKSTVEEYTDKKRFEEPGDQGEKTGKCGDTCVLF